MRTSTRDLVVDEDKNSIGNIVSEAELGRLSASQLRQAIRNFGLGVGARFARAKERSWSRRCCTDCTGRSTAMRRDQISTTAASPSFIATFAGGECTRMTVFTQQLDKPDVGRGVRLARNAYRSRTGKEPAPIIEARFKRNGAVLARYTAEQLTEVTS